MVLPVIFVIAFLDSLIPLVPSETAVILGGIAAGQDDLNIVAVIACGAGGAMLGDNFAYSIGRRFSAGIQRWYQTKPSRAKRLEWADHQLRTRGGSLLLTARFIPGGRTVVTLTSGITRQPWVRFVFFDAIACIDLGLRTRRVSGTSSAPDSRTATRPRSSSRSSPPYRSLRSSS